MENYIGEIRIFAGTFAPVGWLFCDGRLLQISEYDTLYSLLGTTYGGDGNTTFALPSLCSRVVVGQGQAPGMGSYAIGMPGGVETETLSAGELPLHSHVINTKNVSVKAKTGAPGQLSPVGAYFGDQGGFTYSPDSATATMAANEFKGTVTPYGAGGPHANVQPVLALNYIIATVGIYPSRP